MASDSASLADVNRKFWNNNARDIFKQAWVRDLAEQVTDALRSNVGWIDIRKPSENGEPVRLLDYACGNGVASHALAPYVNQVTGIDLSDTMVESYNEVARAEGFLEEQMQAVRGNIVSESVDDVEALSALKYFNFDAVVFSFALHHVESPQEYIGKLVQRLASGGVVVILDWMPSESAEASGSAQRSGADETIKKPSFSAVEMHELLLNAGCSPDSIDYRPYRELSHIPESMTKVEGGVNKRFFVAKARKP